MNLPNVGRVTSLGDASGGDGGLGSVIKLVILLGAQLLLIVVWLLRLALHYSLLLASFLRFSYRLYVELRNDNVERDVIQSEDTEKTQAPAGAPRVAVTPTSLRVLPVHQRARHHAELP